MAKAKTVTLEKDEDTKVTEAAPKQKITDISELPGVGPATADKLKEAGYTDLMTIAVASPSDLAEAADIGEAIAVKIIQSARQMADVGGFETGDENADRR